MLRRLETSPRVRPACHVVGCSTGAFYRDMQLHPEFREKVEEARALGYERVEAEAVPLGLRWVGGSRGGHQAADLGTGRAVLVAEVALEDQFEHPVAPPPALERPGLGQRVALVVARDHHDLPARNHVLLVALHRPADLSRLTDDELRTLIALQHKAWGLEVPA